MGVAVDPQLVPETGDARSCAALGIESCEGVAGAADSVGFGSVLSLVWTLAPHLTHNIRSTPPFLHNRKTHIKVYHGNVK